MADDTRLRNTTLALNQRSGRIPAVGFGTLIPDRAATLSATLDALDAGFRHLDCAERYRNGVEVGEALRASRSRTGLERDDVFVTTKLWNTNHRPERVKAALEGSLSRLGLDEVALYLMHTPFAFKPGDDQDPRDAEGDIVYDAGVTLLETWNAMEFLVRQGLCRAIGVSDIDQDRLAPLYEAAAVKPSVVQVEAHPYLPQTDLLKLCRDRSMVLLAFAPLGHGMRPGPLEDPVVLEVAGRLEKTPAQVLLAWAVQRGSAMLTTPNTPARARENFAISMLPDEAFSAIDRIETRRRYNTVVDTGSLGFIPRGS
jgi:alcohol dehydrogenase (NADP+)